MKNTFTKLGLACSLFLAVSGTASAQVDVDPSGQVVKRGNLWGYSFGDLAYKGSGDTMNAGGRGGSNQYTKVPVNTNLFQWRRIYLGYDYKINDKFSAEFLLAAEDDFASGSLGQSAGDVLQNNKFAPYVKLANVRWKDFFKGTDLVMGQIATPSYAKTGRNDQTAEEVWGYRSIERTITDIRRTPSFDMGIALQGHFDSKGMYGYDLMVGNGQSAKPENDMFKAFYGDVWAKFLHKKLIIDVYQDYQKLNWTNVVAQKANQFHHDRNMTKLFAAYTTEKFTVGFEGYMNTLMGDLQVTGKDKNTYYRTTKAMGVSVYVKGRILANKTDSTTKLGFFARFDNYDPSGNLSNVTGDAALNATAIKALTSQYDPTTKEMFATFGLDFMPFKKKGVGEFHIMPNVWINTYDCALSSDKYPLSANGTASKGTDAVYRLTFYYKFGK